MLQDLQRKVAEKYGPRPFVVKHEFVFPDTLEGGDGVCYAIEFQNGQASIWLRASGLYYETDVPEMESYLSKLPEWPAEARSAIALLSATKHKAYLASQNRFDGEVVIGG